MLFLFDLEGLRDNLELAPEFEDIRRKSLEARKAMLREKTEKLLGCEVKLSLTRVESQKAESENPGSRTETQKTRRHSKALGSRSPLARDLGRLQDLTFTARQSSKSKTFYAARRALYELSSFVS